MEPFIPVAILMGLTFAVCVAIYILTSVLGPKVSLPSKLETYECGVEPEGSARTPFTMKYYLMAVLFLLFDIEAAFFFPWALIYKESLKLGPILLIALLVYSFFMVLALLYVFKKDYLGINR